jgi:uncharacterized protein (TIGR03790 family)
MRYYPNWKCGLLALLSLVLQSSPVSASSEPVIWLPKHRLQTNEIGVIVNDQDPLSVRIANYYLQARHIPAGNLIHVSFKPGRSRLSPEAFNSVRNQAKSQLSDSIQALALTWALPYRVGCMSITSAFTFGFDKAYCSSKTCATTRHNPYYGSNSTAPYSDYGIRPSIAIAAKNFKQAKQLIDRGVTADKSNPEGSAYLLSTSDKNRNVRARIFKQLKQLFSPIVRVNIVDGNSIRDRRDIMFYFTGLTKVPYLQTLGFLPGAIADHLTSAGGVLDGRSQMSALRWLEAGATGSYGTVIEPCNLLGKFPNPGLLMDYYTSGQTLIEAYWKSVQQPGEGLFIGEPLAAPYDGVTASNNATEIILNTRVLRAGMYRILTSLYPVGPYQTRAEPLIIQPQQTKIELPHSNHNFYKIEAAKLHSISRVALNSISGQRSIARSRFTRVGAI